jgi:hypothetical protein
LEGQVSQFEERILDQLPWWDRGLVKDRLTAAYNEGVEEGMARFIYSLLPYNESGVKPKWVERGNSFWQDHCRRQARRAIKEGQA